MRRFKGLTANIADLESFERPIPDDLWVVVRFRIDEQDKIGLKLGTGAMFNDTPWIVDPREALNKIDKPNPEGAADNLFLNQMLQWVEISTSQFNFNDVLEEVDQNDLEIPSKALMDLLRDLTYQKPAINSFSSTSPFIGVINMGTVINSPITLNFNISNKDNIQSGNLSVTDGSWSGLGSIDIKTKNNVVVTPTSPISFNTIKTIRFTLTGIDTKGNSIGSRLLDIVYTHNIYWGTASQKEINGLGDLNALKSVRSNSRLHEMDFTPLGSQHPILLIPSDIPQSGINIVNKNLESVNHSFNMNSGNGGTNFLYNRTINGILYNVYVSFNATSGPAICKVK